MINAEVERLTSDIDYFEAGEGEEREVVQLRLVSTAHEQHLLLQPWQTTRLLRISVRSCFMFLYLSIYLVFLDLPAVPC